ncbi:MAG: transposase [Pseudomonadota bacterium]
MRASALRLPQLQPPRRACPHCGGRDQQLWAARQQARRLPVPYFMLTFTVPQQLHRLFRRHPQVGYKQLFAAASTAVKDLFADPKHFAGQAGFTAVLHTWTRQMQFHPHLHLLVPAAALSEDGCTAIRASNPEFLLPHAPLTRLYRDHFLGQLKRQHPGLYAELDPKLGRIDWNVNLQHVGRGKKAIRYLAAYVSKSAISEERLLGYDRQGRIRVRWTDSNSGWAKVMALAPVELIRPWLQHVLPKGLTRLRHYGYLSAAAVKAYRRLRFLLGGTPQPVALPQSEPISCPCCNQPMQLLRKLLPVRGPPLSLNLLQRL